MQWIVALAVIKINDKFIHSRCVSWSRLKTQVAKNVLKMWRNPGFVLFQLILPIIQITLFHFALGGNPHGIPVLVINDEGNHGFVYFLEVMKKDHGKNSQSHSFSILTRHSKLEIF